MMMWNEGSLGSVLFKRAGVRLSPISKRTSSPSIALKASSKYLKLKAISPPGPSICASVLISFDPTWLVFAKIVS